MSQFWSLGQAQRVTSPVGLYQGIATNEKNESFPIRISVFESTMVVPDPSAAAGLKSVATLGANWSYLESADKKARFRWFLNFQEGAFDQCTSQLNLFLIDQNYMVVTNLISAKLMNDRLIGTFTGIGTVKFDLVKQ